MKKIIAIGLISVSLNACNYYNPRFNMPGMPKPPQQGPQAYLDGWKAGCETGMTAYSSSYLRSRFKTHVDGTRMRHPHYNKGWELGQQYCSYYVSTYLANTEFTPHDLREQNTWFSLKSDGFFSYEGWEAPRISGF